jgi:peptidoglycan hydrolase CwlO-like protein
LNGTNVGTPESIERNDNSNQAKAHAKMKAMQEQLDTNQAKVDANMKTNQEMLAKMESQDGHKSKGNERRNSGQDGSQDRGQ